MKCKADKFEIGDVLLVKTCGCWWLELVVDIGEHQETTVLYIDSSDKHSIGDKFTYTDINKHPYKKIRIV